MTVESSPFGIQANTYSAEITRRATMGAFLKRGATIGSIAGGLVASSDSQITIGSGLHVEVGTGEILVPGSSSATQSGYYLRVSAAETLSIAAADPSNPRVDRISAIVKDAAYTGAENLGTLAVETGTPTSGANLTNLSGVAAAPTSSLTLGYALVPAAASTPSEVKNVAERLVPGLSTATYREGTEANRPAAAVQGRIYYATDKKYYAIDTGSEWVQLTASHGHSEIATEQERTNTAYGTFATPDQVEIFLPANGLIIAGFSALMKNSVGSAGRAAFFLGSNQVKAREAGAVSVQSTGLPSGTNWTNVVSCAAGLTSSGTESASPEADVTTGQVVSSVPGVSETRGGLAAIFAAAGTYVLSVQTKSTSGSVTAKGRKLWAVALAL